MRSRVSFEPPRIAPHGPPAWVADIDALWLEVADGSSTAVQRSLVAKTPRRRARRGPSESLRDPFPPGPSPSEIAWIVDHLVGQLCGPPPLPRRFRRQTGVVGRR
jgi:hypothetical protein